MSLLSFTVARMFNFFLTSLSLMKDEERKKDQLINELQELRRKVAQLEASGAEIKGADNAIKESEDKYRTLLENLPQMIFMKDRNSVYLSCNDNYARDLNIKADEIAGKTDYDFYPKELAEKYRTDDNEIMESGETKDIEETYLQGGKESTVHIVNTPVRNNNGMVVGVLGIFWDITSQKEAEEALERSQTLLRNTFEAIRIAEREKAAVLDSIGELVAYQDREQRILWANRAAGEAAGIASEEFIGRYCYEIWQWRDIPCENCPTIMSLETGQPQEGEMTTPDERTWFVRGYPVRDEKNEIIGVVEVARDISEKKVMEEALVKAKKLESVGILAGGMAHDFNNLLSIIMGNISMAKMDTTQEDGAQKFLDQAEKASLRAKDLTQQSALRLTPNHQSTFNNHQSEGFWSWTMRRCSEIWQSRC
jgi:two-component system, cell cycle sensor histidine kinase and response regulator CckA